MTICKFFIQGTCRFGNKCWYEHPSAGNTGAQRHLNFSNFGDNNQGAGGGGGGGFQTSRQGNQQQQQQQQQTKYKWTAPHLSFGSNNSASQQQQLQSPQEIISGLSREIATWESSKMWLLSCVSFQKSGPSIPGMTDMSPEELRFEAYEAQKTESFNDYIHKVQQMHNEYSAKRQELKSPSTQLRDKLIEFIETSRKQQPGNSSSRFSGSGGSAFGSSSAFGQGATFASETSKVFGNSASNLFGKSETPSNPFASQGNAFGALSSGSAFGYSNPAQSSGTNVFGNSSSGSTAFGGQMGPCVSNVFGSTPNQGLVSQSMNPVSSGSVFGAQGSSSTAQTSAFGAQGSSSPAQTSAFGGATSVFGSPATASGSSPAAGLFGKPAAPASVFGQQSVLGSGMVASNTASAFGSVSVGGSVFGQASPVPEVSLSMYTPMASLTVAELEQYQAQKFTLGKIPTRPPPKELCF